MINIEQAACSIIANAGECRSDCLVALSCIKEKDFEEADKLLKEANDALLKAHEAHTELLFAEARGEKVEMTILLSHASDHLANAETIKDLVEILIDLFKEEKND